MEKIQNQKNSEATIEFVIRSREKNPAGYVIVYDFLKRMFDILICIFFLIILSPILALVSIAILIEDRSSSPIYKSERIGKNGKVFKIFKFRSMKKNADNLDKMLTKEQLERYKKEYKIENDPRITRVGNFLRKTSIDELPQLLNVVKGDMSIVGPRPVLMEETHLYKNDRDKFLGVRPGITGYWQAYARNEAGYECGKRQEMELYYIDNRSIWLDFKILLKTVSAVIKRTGV